MTKNELENILILAGVTLAFIVFSSAVTLVLGRFELTWALLKGIVLLWIALIIIPSIQNFILRLIRSNMYDKSSIFVGSNLLFSSLFCLTWTAFSALQVQNSLSSLGWLAIAVTYFLGLLSSYVGFGVVTAFYTGSLYRTVALILTVLAYGLFSFQPLIASTLFAWFFVLYQVALISRVF